MNIKRSRLRKNSKNKEKYFFGGMGDIAGGASGAMSQIPGIGAIGAFGNLATGIQEGAQTFKDPMARKSKKASAGLGIGADALGAAASIPSPATPFLKAGQAVLEVGSTIAGMIPGKATQAEIDLRNKTKRDERMAQGNLYSKHGGNTDPEYLGVLDPNRLEKISDRLSKIKGPAHKNGGTAMTRNGRNKNFEAEGNEIIDTKSNYMFSNKTRQDLKLDKKFKSGGDLIDKKTEDWNIEQAITYNDKTLIKEGIYDRLSKNGGKIANYKSGGCPPGYDCGGKMKYLPGGTLGALPLTNWDSKDVLNNLNTASSSNPADTTSFGQNAGLKYTGPTSTPNTSGIITNNFDNKLRFNKGTGSAFPNIDQKLQFTKTGPTLTAPSNKQINQANKVGSISAKDAANTNKGMNKLTPGEWTGIAGRIGDSAAQLAFGYKNKPQLVNYSDISAKYDRDTSKAISGMDYGESEAVKDIQGTTNQALNQTSYPSYQTRQAVARNVLQGQGSNISKTRGQFAQQRANARIGVAGESANIRFRTRATQDQINTQEKDAYLQSKADAWKNTFNNVGTIANTMQGPQYRKDLMNAPIKYSDGQYNLDPDYYRYRSGRVNKYGGKIKKSKNKF